MESNEIKKIIKYWQTTAEHDYETMIGLFRIKRYSDSLFFGHIVLEKILKAHVVYATKKEPLHTHDLARLCISGNLELLKDEIDLLNIVNDFNIRVS
ncbi:MAG: HEPN domain-containing protein [bacterium]